MGIHARVLHQYEHEHEHHRVQRDERLIVSCVITGTMRKSIL